VVKIVEQRSPAKIDSRQMVQDKLMKIKEKIAKIQEMKKNQKTKLVNNSISQALNSDKSSNRSG
jgi:hypothetical protein